MALSLPVIIPETAGLARRGDVVFGGVPLARGQLAGGGWFVLQGRDRQAVVEGTPAAWWPDGSVKWLHLCGAVDLAASGPNRFRLVPAAPADVPADGLRAALASAAATVTGGPLAVTLAADAANLLAVARDGAALLVAPGLSATLTYAGPDGENRRSFRWAPAAAAPTAVVQTANRVVLRLPGVFADAAGVAVAELILFVEVLRQSPELRLQPVFIYLGNPDTDLVAALDLTVHSTIRGEGTSYRFANEQGRGFADVLHRYEGGPRWPEARQVQLGPTYFRTEKRVVPEASWVQATAGQRSQGWCQLAGPGGALTAATRYFWEEFPRAHRLNVDEGTLTFGLWPREAAPNDLRRYSPIMYGGAVYEYRPKGDSDRFPSDKGAPGTAKAHELLLRFHPAGENDDGAAAGLAFTQPCRLAPAPAQFAKSAVVGQLAPATPARLPAVEALMARTMDFLVTERERRGWYGQMNYGDIMIAFYSDLDRWAFDDGGYAWLNTEHVPDYGLWLTALRTGRPDWLAAAIAMSRHNRDVDMYHRGQYKAHGTRHNVNHWGCADKEWRISMPLVRRLHYYLTGDPWTAEVIRETVAVFQSYERTVRLAPGLTGALAGIVAKWEMSGDARDGEVARRFADLYARLVRPDGQFTNMAKVDIATGIGEPTGDAVFESLFFMDGFGGQHILVELAELLDHRELSDGIVRYVRWRLQTHPGHATAILAFLAHAWRRTGDPTLLAAIRAGLEGVKVPLGAAGGGPGPLAEPAHPALVGLTRKNKIACWLGGDVLHLLPYGLAALPTMQGKGGTEP